MIELRELWIDGFGCLRTPREPVRFERRRINLFLDDNEAGKTTLQMALLASIFGLEDDRRRLGTSLRPHAAHWQPLAGPPFGTRLRIHDGSRLVELRWNFANGELQALDLGTNKLITDELCPGADPSVLGQSLLGMSVQEFVKTCFVRHDALAAVSNIEGLSALVQRAADTQAGTSTVAAAQERLRSLLRNYRGVMLKGGGLIENEIRRLEDEVNNLRTRLDDLERKRAAVAAEDAEFQRLVAEREQLRQEAAKLDYLAQAAECEELRQRIEKAERHRAKLAALEVERDKGAWLRTFPADQAEALQGWQAERLQRLREAEEAERAIAERRASALEPARQGLEKLGPLAPASREQADEVTELLGKTRDFETREKRHREALEREEARLAAEGASPDELDRLEARFEAIEADDAEFLLAQSRATDQTEAELQDCKRRSADATARIERILAERKSRKEASRRVVVAGIAAGAAALAIAVGLAFMSYIAASAVAVVGIAVGAGLITKGHRSLVAAETHQGDELAQARLEVTQSQQRYDQLLAERSARERRLRSLAARFGYEQGDVLVEDFASLRELRVLCDTLAQLRSRGAELAAQRQELEAEVAARFRAFGLHMPAGVTLSRALADLQDRMQRAVELRTRITEIEGKLGEEAASRDRARKEAERLTEQIRALLTRAGVNQAESIEQGLHTFNELLKQHQRWRQVTEELIPAESVGVEDPKTIETWRADAERLHRAIANMREERPELVALQVKESSREYRRLRDDVREKERAAAAQAEAKGQGVVEVLKRYHAEAPGLQEELAERQHQLARTRRHAAALHLASRVLSEIGDKVHGRWAEDLNESTCAFLQRLAPTLSGLRFDSDLSFGVTHRALPTPVSSTNPTPLLSAGTLDQLCLAVRLGLADFVAKQAGGGLLLLDDPFAHFDEARFDAAVRLLAELARGRHQVLVFSCQRRRFDSLRTHDPQWFTANIVQRSIRPANSAAR